MRREFALASLPAIGLTLATGCGPDPLIGSWNLSSITLDGQTYQIPYVYSGEGYTASTDIRFSLAETESKGVLSGNMVVEQSYTYGEQSGSEESSEAITATVVDKRVYTMTGALFGGDMNLNCTLPETTVECSGTISSEDGEAQMSFSAAMAAE